MDPLSILLLVTIFVFVASLVQLCYLLWSSSKLLEKRKLKQRLLAISAGGKHGSEQLNSYRRKIFQDAGPLEALLLSLPRWPRLDRLLLRAGIQLSVSSFILLSLLGGLLGALLGFRFLPGSAPGALAGLFGLSLPTLWLRLREQQMLRRFEEQLPEALDLLGRALRSGHALSSGLEMVAMEMEEPIAGEFATVVDETKLGLTLKEALENLCERVPNRDLRFFTIAIMVQKETGGNIAEILDNISRLIRERIQFKRQVDTLTAEGKASAVILMALPPLMFIYVYFVNYNYISLLWTEQLGRYLIAGALGLQVLGGLLISKIINVKM